MMNSIRIPLSARDGLQTFLGLRAAFPFTFSQVTKVLCKFPRFESDSFLLVRCPYWVSEHFPWGASIFSALLLVPRQISSTPRALSIVYLLMPGPLAPPRDPPRQSIDPFQSNHPPFLGLKPRSWMQLAIDTPFQVSPPPLIRFSPGSRREHSGSFERW